MNELLARAEAFFLTPATAAPARVAPPAADRAAVLAAPGDLAAVAGGLAASLRRRARAQTAVVATIGAGSRPRPATPAASALARRLARRDLVAVAAGALCLAALPPDPRDAAREAWRLLAAAGVPVVLAIARREPELDGLLADLDLLAVAAPAGSDPALAELAAASLERLGPRVRTLTTPTGILARRAAALGLSTAPAREHPDPLPVPA